MKSGGPLKRRTKLKPRRERERRSGRQRDTAYMLWVKTLNCCAWRGTDASPMCVDGVFNNVEAHHAGRRAAGRKANDDTCIPLCNFHHRCWHSGAPPFDRWTREQRREWADARIADTQAKWRARQTAESCPF